MTKILFLSSLYTILENKGAISIIRTCSPKEQTRQRRDITGQTSSECFRDKKDTNEAYCHCSENMCNTDIMSNVTQYSYEGEINDEESVATTVDAIPSASRKQNSWMFIILICVTVSKSRLISFMTLDFI